MVDNRPHLARSREVPLRASRWFTLGVLLSPKELDALLFELPQLHLYRTGAVVPRGEERIDRHALCNTYREHLTALCEGKECALPSFSASADPDDLYALSVRTNEVLVRPCRPVIQVRPHTITYSSDGTFLSMVRGTNRIAWGLEFSYPQLFQEPDSDEIVRVDQTFASTEPFRRLRQWVRHHTRPVAFLVNKRRFSTPFRLGKVDWIDGHPQLVAQGIQVAGMRAVRS